MPMGQGEAPEAKMCYACQKNFGEWLIGSTIITNVEVNRCEPLSDPEMNYQVGLRYAKLGFERAVRIEAMRRPGAARCFP